MKKPSALNEERPFLPDELFFSVTDTHGKILFGNETFVKISAYPKDSLLNSPHSIIRHPDMPKTVFKLFWDTLKQDRPIAAYVKNMAMDGKYYWVFAFAFPVHDGYISIRLKPTSAIFEKVKTIYAKVLQKEDPKVLSFDHILELLKEEGYSSYQEFMVMAAIEEIGLREQYILEQQKLSLEKLNPNEIRRLTQSTSKELDSSFKRIHGFQETGASITASINHLTQEFNKLSFVSVNMTILAAKYGTHAATIEVVSSEFSKVSREIYGHLSAFSNFSGLTAKVILDCSQCIIALKTQMIMVEYFVNESIRKNAFNEMLANQSYFCELFDQSLRNLNDEMRQLKANIHDLGISLGQIHTSTVGLEVIQLVGSVESSRDGNLQREFNHYLIEMKSFVKTLKEQFVEISAQTALLESEAYKLETSNRGISGNIRRLFRSAQGDDQKKCA